MACWTLAVNWFPTVNRCEYVFSGIKYPTVTLNFLKLLPCCFQSPKEEAECKSPAGINQHSSSAFRRAAPNYCSWGLGYLNSTWALYWNACVQQHNSSHLQLQLNWQTKEHFWSWENLLPTCHSTSQAHPRTNSHGLDDEAEHTQATVWVGTATWLKPWLHTYCTD